MVYLNMADIANTGKVAFDGGDFTMEKLKQPKKIALIAHDSMKESLCQCAL
jgi:hypothetical protein